MPLSFPAPTEGPSKYDPSWIQVLRPALPPNQRPKSEGGPVCVLEDGMVVSSPFITPSSSQAKEEAGTKRPT